MKPASTVHSIAVSGSVAQEHINELVAWSEANVAVQNVARADLIAFETDLLALRTAMVHARQWSAVSAHFPPEPGILTIADSTCAWAFSKTSNTIPSSTPASVKLC